MIRGSTADHFSRAWYVIAMVAMDASSTQTRKGTMRTNICKMLLAVSAACALAMNIAACGGMEGDTEDDLDVATEAAPLIGTTYDYGSRTIYAPASRFMGTPMVRITTKTAVTNTCNRIERVMSLMPQTQVTRSLCGQLGLVWRIVAASGGYCTTTTTNTTPTGVYRYNYTNPLQRELNYNVVDWDGVAQRVLDQSGWIPSISNGCPRS
jgi:hypothetical protein